MNVKIPMPKGTCIAFECLRAAGEGGSAEVLRHLGFGILSSFLIRISSFTFLDNRQAAEEHQII